MPFMQAGVKLHVVVKPSNVSAANLEKFLYKEILVPAIKTLKAERHELEIEPYVLLLDGNRPTLNALDEPEMRDLFADAGIRVGKGPASTTAIFQVLDVSPLFRSVKACVRARVETKEIDKHQAEAIEAEIEGRSFAILPAQEAHPSTERAFAEGCDRAGIIASWKLRAARLVALVETALSKHGSMETVEKGAKKSGAEPLCFRTQMEIPKGLNADFGGDELERVHVSIARARHTPPPSSSLHPHHTHLSLVAT